MKWLKAALFTFVILVAHVAAYNLRSSNMTSQTERHPLLDIGLPQKEVVCLNHHAWQAGCRLQYGGKMHRERCCTFSYKSLSRLLQHPPEEMGYSYSLRLATHGTDAYIGSVFYDQLNRYLASSLCNLALFRSTMHFGSHDRY